jgi:hypothetical protein
MFLRYSNLQAAKLNFAKNFQKLFQSSQNSSSDPGSASDEPESGFTLQNLGFLGCSALFLMSIVGGINWAVDPLWFGRGNKITYQNFDFPDERILKTNLFLNTKEQAEYDCLIFGSSRTNALRPSAFENENCFNYSFKSGHIEEFVRLCRVRKATRIRS